MKWSLTFLLILWGLAISFRLENGRGTEQETKRVPAKLDKRVIEKLWQWRNPLPPPSFFAGDKRPEGLPNIGVGKEIEQYLPSDPPGTPPYFVSLFDPSRNIPFYSAYKVTSAQGPNIGTYGRQYVKTWRNPPGAPYVDNAYKEANAKDGQTLSRGHMNPAGINTFDKSFMSATYTLTNAAPQFEASNNGPWSEFENRIKNYAKTTCRGTLYLLTGTSDYGLATDSSTGKPVQDTRIPLPYTRDSFPRGVKLVTPRALWSAGCCVRQEPGGTLGYWWPSSTTIESFAVMSNNQNNPNLLHQTEMSVAQLEELLTAPGTRRVNLFPGNSACRSDTNTISP